MDLNQTTKIVREKYGAIARQQNGCGCGCSCGDDVKAYAKSLGYSENELGVIPAEANLGLSCGNPTAVAGLKEGEVVLDLGSGAGFDCFLAAAKVGPQGRVIGVDMTPEMLEKARTIARQDNVGNVEFRLGEIENLPVADNSVDVVISNCVINLSADKARVLREIYRVLNPGGRVAVSDIVLLKELPEKLKSSIEAYVGCVAGALPVDRYREVAAAAGIKDIKINLNNASVCIDSDTRDPIGRAVLDSLEEGQSLESYIASAYIEGVK